MLPYLVIGITTGSLYGLAGLGLVLTYRTSGVLNFAHGTVAAAAAFLFYELHVTHGLPWPPAMLLTVALFGAIGGPAMDRVARVLVNAPDAVVVLLTVGLSLAIQGYLFLQFGNVTRQFPQFLPTTGFQLSGVLITWAQVISTLVGLGAAIGLYLFLRTSRLGVSMRAVVDNRTLTELTGSRASRITRTSWVIGTSFAALCGVLLAPTIGLDATLLTLLVVQAFGACAIGLFSSLPLTYVGAVVVGVATSLSTQHLTAKPWAGIPPSVPFIVLIVVLLVVPGRKLPRVRSTVGALSPEPFQWPRGSRAAAGLIAGAVLLMIPHVVGVRLPLYINALTYFVLFASLALLTWTSGQISLCQLAFVALGGSTMGHLTSHGLPWLAALLLAGLVTVPVGVLLALPAIRLSGIYLALLTLGFGIFMQQFMYQTELMFGKATIVTTGRPRFGSINGNDDTHLYYIVLAVALVVAGLLTAINCSRLGRLLRAMAESPTMLATNGLSVSVTRIIVFCVSAFLAGIAGALTLTQFGSLSGQNYGPIQSLVLLAVLAICGLRLLRSPIIAAILLTILPGYVTRFGQNEQLLCFGIAAVVSGILLAARNTLHSQIGMLAAEGAPRLERSPVRERIEVPRGRPALPRVTTRAGRDEIRELVGARR
jgi:branched-subunit amino acid ABC-type transport system permease component